MPERFIPFTGFAPGSPEHGTRLLRAENVIPAMGAWRPMSQMDAAGGSLVGSGPLLGGYCHVYPSGLGAAGYSGDAVTEFWGSKLNLYTYDPVTAAFTSRSRGGGYSAGALVPAEWNFCSYGNDVWAANGVDVMQVRANNAGSFANGVTSAFVPVARYVGVVREFLVAGFLNQANRFADEVVWSDVGGATYFSPRDAALPSSAAGGQRIRSRRGQLTGFVGGEYGRWFKQRSLHGMSLTGGDDVFRFDEISPTTGTTCGKSIIESSDGFLRFWGGDGFYRQAGFSAPEKISPASLNNLLIEANMDQVWKYAMTRNAPTTMYNEGLRVIGAEGRQSGINFWLYLSTGATPTALTRVIAHDPSSGEWGLLNLEEAAGAGFIAAQTGLSCIMSLPVNVTDSFGLTWDLLGASTDLADATRVTFDQTTPMQATFATQRFALAEDGALATSNPRITGFMPVTSRDALAGSPDYNLRALPAGVVVRIIGANDPHFVITSEAGTQISPRSEVFTRDTDFGWWTGSLQARWFIAEMIYPAGGVNERGFVGAYVRWE